MITSKIPVEELLLDSLRIKGETTTSQDLEKGVYGENEISDFYKEYCRQLGLDVSQDSSGNVIAVMDKGSGRTINFNGHMDTKQVPEELKVRIEDDFVYGRGACDMRGAIASMLDSAADITQRRLKGKIVYTFVVCEESGEKDIRDRGTSSVIRYLQKNGLSPGAVIVGEASQSIDPKYTLCDGERGRYTTTIRIIGKGAHAAWGSRLGINAHVIASKILPKISFLDRTIGQDSNLHVKFGVIDDGSYNIVPDSCLIQIDMRYRSNEVLERMKRSIFDIIEKNLDGGNYAVKEENYLGEPWASTDTAFRGNLLYAYKKLTGREPRVMKSRFGTDGRFIRMLFGPSLPIYIAGPGYQEIAHSSNENVPLQHVKDYSRIYTEVVLSYLST